MIDFEEAHRRALRKVREVFDLSSDGDEAVLCDEQTVYHDAGWLFFYNSKAFLETGDFSRMLMGNAPLFVSKRHGEVLIARADVDAKQAIEEVLRAEGPRGLGVPGAGL